MDTLYKTNINLFLGAFIVTIFMIYLTTPMPKFIFKYPTPHTADKLIYQRHGGDCYKYKPNVVPCPSNPKVMSETLN